MKKVILYHLWVRISVYGNTIATTGQIIPLQRMPSGFEATISKLQRAKRRVSDYAHRDGYQDPKHLNASTGSPDSHNE